MVQSILKSRSTRIYLFLCYEKSSKQLICLKFIKCIEAWTKLPRFALTHWGRVTHICISKQTIFGSDNGLSPCRRQAIIWTNTGILLIGTLGTKLSEILCRGLNVLTTFSSAFPWIKITLFLFKFHWILWPMLQLKKLCAKWQPFFQASVFSVIWVPKQKYWFSHLVRYDPLTSREYPFWIVSDVKPFKCMFWMTLNEPTPGHHLNQRLPSSLTHLGWVTRICVIELDHHWFR